MKKRIKRLLISLLCVLLLATPAMAEGLQMEPISEEPMYDAFTYAVKEGKTYRMDSPVPYRPVGKVTAESLGVALSAPADLYVTADSIYIADQEQNTVICTDLQFRVRQVLDGFVDKNGKKQLFSEPQGVCFVNGKLYVADSGNNRVVVLDEKGGLVSLIERPELSILSETLNFVPLKVDVDTDGRIYVIVKGVYEGIMEFYEDGSCGGFVGSIPVKADPLTALWKKLLSKEQSDKLERFIPVEYTNLCLDADGFIYTVSLMAEEQDNIRRLNSAGSDILIRDSLGNIDICGAVACANGDNSEEVFSKLEDIYVDADGTYYVLDSQYGRVFTYDSRGNMLFAFGGMNMAQNGTFEKPSAIALVGDTLCVSDRESGCITLFERTAYAQAILTAVGQYHDDLYAESIETWNAVLQLNSNFTMAYSMIGKALYQMGDYRQAMDNYRIAGDQEGYSKAFEQWRDNLYRENFVYIVLGLAAVIVLIAVASAVHKRYRRKHPKEPSRLWKDLCYPFYVVFHPFDGFWDLKYEKRGKAWISTLLIALTIVTMTLERGLTGFSVSATPDYAVDILYQLKLVLVPLALFIVGNMSITTLMDGKGSFKDLYIASGYVLFPFVLVKLPLLLVSELLSRSEGVYVTLLNVVAVLWVAFLIFSALMSIHEYTAGKAVATILLTVVAMVIICFICMLFFSLFSELVGFLYTIYRELTYR